MSQADDFSMEELRRELDALEDDPNFQEDFSFMDYLAGSNPETLREKVEREQNTPGKIVGSQVIQEEEEDELSRNITYEDIKAHASAFYPETKVYRSMLLELFTPEQCIEIEKLTRTFSIDNNQKISIIKEKLEEWGIDFKPLGGGTNRWAFMYDGYVVKIACDEDGKIDNTREYIYPMQLQPYVIKCYECHKDGLMAVFEYVEVFNNDDFWKHQNEMREILEEISENFLIGDVGVSTVNYVNWGFRDDHSLVILDFAYIYSVAFKKFECGCTPGAYLAYDKDFNNLICPYCGKKYSFRQIRKKISMRDQKREIGDLYEKGYILSSSEEVKDFEPKFVSGAYDDIKRKLLKIRRKNAKKMDKKVQQNKVFDNDVLYTEDEIIDKIMSGTWNNN